MEFAGVALQKVQKSLSYFRATNGGVSKNKNTHLESTESTFKFLTPFLPRASSLPLSSFVSSFVNKIVVKEISKLIQKEAGRSIQQLRKPVQLQLSSMQGQCSSSTSQDTYHCNPMNSEANIRKPDFLTIILQFKPCYNSSLIY